ncbi:MAG TPA: glycoside hydrolase family 65 protein [Candidatus Pelethocola excrementipullorum]|nr:glycoside hydrolase family 65 protein [Candidatus Pelethocola excrementipullorum]
MEHTDLLCRPWDITETESSREHNYRNETIFSIGNGYLGTRGTFEENYDFGKGNGMEGNFLNGFYESEPIRYGEFNYGFPKKSQSMLNVTNAKILRIVVDHEEFHLYEGKVTEYERNLSLQNGVLTRSCIWETHTHKKMRITFERLASFSHERLLSIRLSVEPLNFDGTIRILSEIETDVCNHTSENNPLIDYGPYGSSLLLEETKIADATLTTLSRVKNNGFFLYTGCCHSFTVPSTSVPGTDEVYVPSVVSTRDSGHLPEIVFDVMAEQNRGISLTKHIVYNTHDSVRDVCRTEGNRLLLEAEAYSFEMLKKEQRVFLDVFWDKTDVSIDGDERVQQGLRFNLFHILQSTGRDGFTSVGAKGLSGEGYEGHYFWDTEMYIIPMYTHTFPELSKNLLLYRYHTLDAARNHARELGHGTGALYPWRTINGNEASAYYPLGSAQYHINGDIAYAVNQYGRITGNKDFMYCYGLEMLCEISRVFADVGHFSDWKDGQYVISCVTGPDEYNAVVDNNFYTNLGAREAIKNTFFWLDALKNDDIVRYNRFLEKLNLHQDEFDLWRRVIDKMYLGYDEKLNVYVQDDTFLQKKPWDAITDKEKKGSLLYVNFHPLYVFRHQMCKQADTPLAMLLFNHLFTDEEMRKNYEFYYPRTIHHSSLSHSIFAIIESRLGKYDSAYQNFITSARMDLDDCHNNVYAGIHGANMAGTWMTLTYGLAGMNTTDGNLHFNPYLPKNWNSYSFKVTYHDSVLRILVSRGKTTYTLEEGESVSFAHSGRSYILNKHKNMVVVE